MARDVNAIENVPLSRHGFIIVGYSGTGTQGGERCASSIFLGQKGFCAVLQDFTANGARHEADPQQFTVRRHVHIPSPSSALVRNSLQNKFEVEGSEALILQRVRRPGRRFLAARPVRNKRRTERT